MKQSWFALSGTALTLMSIGCVTERVVVREVGARPYSPPPAYHPPPPSSVVSVYIEAPIGQPAAIGCPWAPPMVMRLWCSS